MSTEESLEDSKNVDDLERTTEVGATAATAETTEVLSSTNNHPSSTTTSTKLSRGETNATTIQASRPKRTNHNHQQQNQPPMFHLVIANIQKIANVRSMMKAAVAFGCQSILLVGQEKNSKRPNFFPPHFQDDALKTNQIQLHTFAKWKECLTYMKDQSIFLIGVEIDEQSHLLDDEYFQHHFPKSQQNIGLLMGNEGQGILPHYLQECQQIIRIPQYGKGTASLNVNVASNIVLYRFQCWKQRHLNTHR